MTNRINCKKECICDEPTLTFYSTCRITRWINLFGDPRDFKNLRQIIDWIELIPYAETRNYTQRVLENLQVYRSIINRNNNIKLEQDLLKTKDNKREI